MVEYRVSETGLDPNRLAAFAARLHGVAREDVRLEIRTIRGGSQAAPVARVVARVGGATNGCASFVVKRLEARAERESDAYRALGELGASDVVPRFLGVERLESGQSYLYLEHVVRQRAWPWGDEELAGQVLEQLAWLHTSLKPQGPFASSA